MAEKLTLADAIDRLWKGLGYPSQGHFAIKELDVQPSQLSDWKTGRKTIGPGTAIRFGNLSPNQELALFFWEMAGMDPAAVARLKKRKKKDVKTGFRQKRKPAKKDKAG